MPLSARSFVVWFVLALLAAGTVWSLSFKPDEPADFTMVNPSEVKSVDPAMITGQIEGRLADALFEGLTTYEPKTLAPLPGMAESWTLSDDKRTYTFKIRDGLKWSNGDPLTAHDFEWSHRRTLDPQTASQYAYQLWYVKHGRQYTSGRVYDGDKVEVELNDRPAGARKFARGQLLKGTLISVTPKFPPIEEEEPKPPKRKYVVEIAGKRREFYPGRPDADNGCKQILIDFAEVGCKALDEHTYQMTLDNPTPYFIDLTNMYPLFPTNQRCVETYGFPEWTKPENMVTNGPFRLERRYIRERTRLVKSDSYWNRAAVKLNTVDVLVVESDTTALNLYLKGQADWIPTVPVTIIKQLVEKFPDQIHPQPTFQLYFYRLNVTKPPLDNPLVRKALALAMNKRAIVDNVSRAGEVPADSFVPPVIRNYPGFKDYKSATCGSYNPDLARELLAKAGYPGGRGLSRIPLLYNSDEGHKMIAELVQRQWKENLGVDVDPQNQEWSAFLAAQSMLDYNICRAGWVGDYVDPMTFLGMFITGGEDNQTGWSNPKYDALIDAAKKETDNEKRLQQLHDAEAILMDELPIIPIYFGVDKNMVKPYVRGFERNVLDTHPIGKIWVDREAKEKFLGRGEGK